MTCLNRWWYRFTLWSLCLPPRLATWALTRLDMDPVRRERLFATMNKIRGCLFVRRGETVRVSGELLWIYCEGDLRVTAGGLRVLGSAIFGEGALFAVDAPEHTLEFR